VVQESGMSNRHTQAEKTSSEETQSDLRKKYQFHSLRNQIGTPAAALEIGPS